MTPPEEEAVAMMTEDNASPSSTQLSEFNSMLAENYPRLERDGIMDGVVVLPPAQIVSLWVTLHDTLYNSIKDNPHLTRETRKFVVKVGDSLSQVLAGIKLSDGVFQSRSKEKVSELLLKLHKEILTEENLGRVIKTMRYRNELVYTFLKLALVSAEIRGILEHHDGGKFASKPEGQDTFNYFPCFTTEKWEELTTRISTSGSSKCKDLMIDLTAQRLKFLLVQKHRSIESKSDLDLIQPSITKTTDFLWSHVKIRERKLLLDNVHCLSLSSASASEILRWAEINISNIIAEDVEYTSFPNDIRVHFAIILVIFDRVLKNVVELKFLKKFTKKLRRDILALKIRLDLIHEPGSSEFTVNQKNLYQNLLEAANFIINSANDSEADGKCVNQNSDELISFTKFLATLPLAEYPKSLTTFVFLTTLPSLIIIADSGHKILLDDLTVVLEQVSRNFVGNEFIFSISWLNLFRWLLKGSENFSPAAKQCLTLIIFQNIYLSPKAVEEFNSDLEVLFANFTLGSPTAPIAFTILKFLIQESSKLSLTKGKSKTASLLQHNLQLLINSVLKSLRRLIRKGIPSNSHLLISNVFQACWLLERGAQILQESKFLQNTAVNVCLLKEVTESQLENAIHYVSESNQQMQDMDLGDFKVAKKYAIEFLANVCKSQSHPSGFIMKLWKMYIRQEYVSCETETSGTDFPVLKAKDIFTTSTVEEFEEIGKQITKKLKKMERANSQENAQLGLLAHLLQEMLELSGIAPEKKSVRRRVFETALVCLLSTTVGWNGSESSITNNVIPFLQFQIKLIRRRTAICPTNSLSLCLSSITSSPLNDVVAIKLYRKLFSVVAELLNAFTIHRQDVLSFRHHLYLQCFQYLLESLTMKADQKCQLSDDEILDLRYCAHGLERICQSAKLNEKEFARLSPYFIAIMMKQFEVFTVYPAVKEPLQSGCYKLLDLCDKHGMVQLNSMFSLGSREIFKTVFDVYTKFYRYKGKV